MSDQRKALEAVVGPVSRETIDSLVSLTEQLVLWNRRINLVSDTTIQGLWQRHIIDSAQLLSLAPPSAVRWLDIGSGGGFPGLVVAIFLKERPGARIELVESNRKKTGFLQAMVGLLDLPADVTPSRIENLSLTAPLPDIITARALSALPTLLDLTFPWLSGQTTALFHKGREYRREIEESSDRFHFDLVEHPSAVDSDSIILEISKLRKRD